MSVRWERLDGDTAAFAIKVAFHADPDEGQGADAETAASWGTLELWVDGKNLCVHQEQGETLQSVHWYLLPFFEWLAANWDPLLHEERLPGNVEDDAASLARDWDPLLFRSNDLDAHALERAQERFDWDQRHGIRAARDGGIFPGAYMRRIRDRIEISWRNLAIAGAYDVDFVSLEGRSYQEPHLVAESLYAVVDDAVDWLHRQVPHSPRLDRLRESFRGLRSVERSDDRLSWVAGLRGQKDDLLVGWQSLRHRFDNWTDQPAVDRTLRASTGTSDLVIGGSSKAALLFASTSPNITDDDVNVLTELLLKQYRTSADLSRLDRYAHSEPLAPLVRPWEQGYSLALDLQEEMHDATPGLVDLDALFEMLGITLCHIDLADSSIKAVSFVSPQHLATTALNGNSTYARSSTARRFTLAHELCHLLFDRETGVGVAVASGPWAPATVEKRANAFAAMYLMPPGQLKRAIRQASAPFDSFEGISEVAEALAVSTSALVEHAHNLGFLDSTQRDTLTFRLSSEDPCLANLSLAAERRFIGPSGADQLSVGQFERQPMRDKTGYVADNLPALLVMAERPGSAAEADTFEIPKQVLHVLRASVCRPVDCSPHPDQPSCLGPARQQTPARLVVHARNLARVASVRPPTNPRTATKTIKRRSDVTGISPGCGRAPVDLAACLVVSPAVLYLDEPTTGLDPRGRNEVWQAVRDLADTGTTVLLTTQYLDEADQLAERVADMER